MRASARGYLAAAGLIVDVRLRIASMGLFLMCAMVGITGR